MREFRLAFPACVVAGKPRLTAADVGLLRRHVFPEGIRTADDIVAVMALNGSCPEKCPEWNAFFVEQLADFIVHHTYPQGSLDAVNLAWIIRMFTTDGAVNSPLELELVLHIMEISSPVPEELRVLALDQLRLAITDDVGGYRPSRAVDRRGITRQDVDYVVRILKNSSDRGAIDVTPAEHAVLQRIEGMLAAGEDRALDQMVDPLPPVAQPAPAIATEVAPIAEAAADGAAGELVRSLHFEQGASRKFWRAALRGNELTVSYGRIGSTGQSLLKQFDTPERAMREMEKLVDEKLRKGYLED